MSFFSGRLPPKVHILVREVRAEEVTEDWIREDFLVKKERCLREFHGSREPLPEEDRLPRIPAPREKSIFGARFYFLVCSCAIMTSGIMGLCVVAMPLMFLWAVVVVVAYSRAARVGFQL
jgi:hypothetical protein